MAMSLVVACASQDPYDGSLTGDTPADSGWDAKGDPLGDSGADASPAPDTGAVPQGDSSPTPTDAGASGEGSVGCAFGPQTALHYAAGWSGDSAGAALGLNIADVSSASEASALPAGTKALVWLGLCGGADSSFVSAVKPFIGVPNVYGFYLMDEPDPTGQYQPPACSPADLKAESDWIHANVPGAKTFIVMMNLGSDSAPSYDGSYNPANTGIDLYGLDPYPCQPANKGCDYSELAASVAAAKSWGIPEVAIVPVYQAFGGGGYATWMLPTATQEQTILTAWGSLVPKPELDYVYAWGSQQNDTALAQSPDLQTVFAAHDFSTCANGGEP